MSLPDRVRFLPAAVDDLRALHRRDPQILRQVLKKVLVINTSPYAGAELGGPLVGFRKLVVGDRHWRIVWRVTAEGEVEIAEVWGAGARADGEIYREVTERLAAGDPGERAALIDVMRLLRAAREVLGEVAAPREPLPAWLAAALRDQVGLPEGDLAGLTPEQANRILADWYARPPR